MMDIIFFRWIKLFIIFSDSIVEIFSKTPSVFLDFVDLFNTPILVETNCEWDLSYPFLLNISIIHDLVINATTLKL